jgi:type II secretory pathway component GspD/PulD (secretin)
MRAVAAGVLACAAAAATAQALEIIELRNRPAEQLLPILQPLAAPGGVITGSGFQLIVRTTPANLAQLKQVIASLDRAPRQLVIKVRQESGGAATARGVGADVELRPGDSRAGASLYDRTGTAQDNVAQQVRVQEGMQARILGGTSTLVPQRTVTRTATGAVVVQESSVQRDYNTGFVVTPRVNGDRVTLEIGAQRDTVASPGSGAGPLAADVNRVSSSVSGRLGEWIELGGTSQSYESQSRGVLARSSDAGSRERRVWVMVEEAR